MKRRHACSLYFISAALLAPRLVSVSTEGPCVWGGAGGAWRRVRVRGEGERAGGAKPVVNPLSPKATVWHRG